MKTTKLKLLAMILNKKTAIIILFAIFPSVIFCQQLFDINNNSSYNKYERHLYSKDVNFHTSIKPYFIPEINKKINLDSLFPNKKDSLFKGKLLNGVWNKIFNENFIYLNKEGLELTIDPVFNFEVGRNSEKSTFVNTRGFLITGSIGSDFSFTSSFYENQASFVDYVDTFIFDNRIVPGQGETRNFSGKTGGDYDYSMSNGYISYTPSKYFNFQFGHGKNFFGDGYRSLLLSDNSFNYPFLKLTTNVWKLKYINLYTQFQDLLEPHTFESGYQKKYGSFHYLSYNVNNRLSVGLFEGIIWQARDSSGSRGFDVNYLNPVIFYRSVEYSLGSPDNAILGMNLSYIIGKKNTFYGQVILDEFKLSEMKNGDNWWGNKFGYQLGFKTFDLLKIKNLDFQTEYNRVRPYTYSHKNTLQNYGHYNQPIAHPLGANFFESVTFIRYKYKRLNAEAKFLYAKYGDDPTGSNYGGDIYKSYNTRSKNYGNTVAQGIENTLSYKNLRISYMLNPKTNMNISLGISDRIQKTSSQNNHSTFVYFAFRTSLDNFYFDF